MSKCEEGRFGGEKVFLDTGRGEGMGTAEGAFGLRYGAGWGGCGIVEGGEWFDFEDFPYIPEDILVP